jgi:hypothetical protein
MIPLFFALLALAALPAKKPIGPLWSLEFKGEHPEAAFFDAASGAIFVSVRNKNGESGRIAKVSQTGKLEIERFAESKGPPGALRAFDGKIFWISGNQVQSKGDEGVHTEGTVATEFGALRDIAVDRHGTIYVGTSNGTLVQLRSGVASAVKKGQPITGLFLSQDTLHILRGTKLQSIIVSTTAEPAATSLPFICEKDCSGLERTGAGKWLTVNGRRVIEVGASAHTLYEAPNAKAMLGRPAYVYQMNTEDDFFVVPVPNEQVIRAFPVNAASK